MVHFVLAFLIISGVVAWYFGVLWGIFSLLASILFTLMLIVVTFER